MISKFLVAFVLKICRGSICGALDVCAQNARGATNRAPTSFHDFWVAVRPSLATLLICLLFLSCRKEQQLNRVDLLKKLQFATVRLDTNFIDIGNPHFRSHLLDGWGADRKDEEKINSAAVAQRTAELKFFCHSPQDRMLTIRCKTESGSAEAQSLDVILN